MKCKIAASTTQIPEKPTWFYETLIQRLSSSWHVKNKRKMYMPYTRIQAYMYNMIVSVSSTDRRSI